MTLSIGIIKFTMFFFSHLAGSISRAATFQKPLNAAHTYFQKQPYLNFYLTYKLPRSARAVCFRTYILYLTRCKVQLCISTAILVINLFFIRLFQHATNEQHLRSLTSMFTRRSTGGRNGARHVAAPARAVRRQRCS